MKSLFAWGLIAAVASLAACAEKEQVAQAGARKGDAQAWAGADAAYTAPGWKAGDQASWEAQIKTRNQAQNEYARTTSSGQ